MKRHCIINGKYIGSSQPIDPTLFSPPVLWYCWKCGEVYARLPVDGGEEWRGKLGCCGKCASEHSLYRQLPGSVWGINDEFYNGQLPKEVLERELEIAIKMTEAQEDGN